MFIKTILVVLNYLGKLELIDAAHRFSMSFGMRIRIQLRINLLLIQILDDLTCLRHPIGWNSHGIYISVFLLVKLDDPISPLIAGRH